MFLCNNGKLQHKSQICVERSMKFSTKKKHVWHGYGYLFDFLQETYINDLEAENRRLHVLVRWLEDNCQKCLAELQDCRAQAGRLETQLQECRAQSQQSHANWLSSLRTPVPTTLSSNDPGPCHWHSSANNFHNVAQLPTVVGRCNQITSTNELESLLTHLNVTLFRNDKTFFEDLCSKMRVLFSAGRIQVCNGKPHANKWIHITCVDCGKFVFTTYPMAGNTNRQVSEEDHAMRRSIFEFFECPFRLLNSSLLPEV